MKAGSHVKARGCFVQIMTSMMDGKYYAHSVGGLFALIVSKLASRAIS